MEITPPKIPRMQIAQDVTPAKLTQLIGSWLPRDRFPNYNIQNAL